MDYPDPARRPLVLQNMPEYRTDPLGGHTVIIAPERQSRPGAFGCVDWGPETIDCPFCRGHESETPEEVCVSPPTSTNLPWQVRVVPNLYPALLPAESAARNPAAKAVGQHEVIIEAPNHQRSLTQLDRDHVAAVLATYAERVRAAAHVKGIRHALVFKNHGPAAGATLQHAHSQLIAMDRVPDVLNREISSAAEYFGVHRRCIVCDTIDKEIASKERLVLLSDEFVVYCPAASRLPFEMRLVPRHHQARFEDVESHRCRSLAETLRQTLNALESLIPHVSYNYLIHSLPFDTNRNEHYHWHIEIIPRIATAAGFEWGSGMFLNPVPPEQAAEQLRSR